MGYYLFGDMMIGVGFGCWALLGVAWKEGGWGFDTKQSQKMQHIRYRHCGQGIANTFDSTQTHLCLDGQLETSLAGS